MSDIFFAWCTETDTTWTETFKRKDEDIVSIEGEHSENNFPTLNMVIKNPRVGLLAPGRYVWGWFAYEADDTAGTVTPFFFGQLVGIPDDLLGESLTLSFIAKAKDFDVQKMNVALSMMTAPQYDPIFVAPEKRPSFATDGTMKGDVDCVLEGWPKLWHFDRTTLAVSASHILTGEDGTEEFQANEIPRASVQLRRGQAPLTGITVIGKVPWTQAGTGPGIDFGTRTFNSYNGLSIAQSWPQTGQQLSGGYSVTEGWALDVNGIGGAQVRQMGFRYENRAKSHKDGETMSINWDYAVFPCDGLSYLVAFESQPGSSPAFDWGNGAGLATTGWNTNLLPEKYSSGQEDQNIPSHSVWEILLIAQVKINTKLVLGWDAGIGRSETVMIKLSADLQPIVVLPDPADVTESITVDGADAGIPIDGTPPLTDPTAYNFFPTDRGQLARDHLVCVGTTHLKNRARMVTVSWDVTFDRMLALSCRKNATINDERIPGGTATGKIIKYTWTASLQTGFRGNVTIGCCVGHGGTVSASAGTPSIWEAGVVDTGIQVYTGATSAIDSEITIPPSVYEAADGELKFPLTKEQVLISETITHGTMPVQIGEGVDPWTGQQVVNNVEVPTDIYRLELKSLSGGIEHLYDLTATPLKLPKQIDLEAASWA